MLTTNINRFFIYCNHTRMTEGRALIARENCVCDINWAPPVEYSEKAAWYQLIIHVVEQTDICSEILRVLSCPEPRDWVVHNYAIEHAALVSESEYNGLRPVYLLETVYQRSQHEWPLVAKAMRERVDEQMQAITEIINVLKK